jgi:hypothetical protein
MKRLLCIVLLTATLHGRSRTYDTGTVIAWTEVNHTVFYRVSTNVIDYDYLLSRDDISSGWLDKNTDPLRLLKPQQEFKFRLDSNKHRIIVLWENHGKQHKTRYKILGMEPREDKIWGIEPGGERGRGPGSPTFF